MDLLWSQRNILNYLRILIFIFIILLYSLEGEMFTDTKQQIRVRFHWENGVRTYIYI